MPSENPRKPRIVVIDDDTGLREAIRAILEAEGYEVVEALNGAAAFEALRSPAADLVVCDMFMPGMDGLEILRKLRREFPAVPVIAISGGGNDHSGLDVLHMARHLGAAHVLHKPLRRAKFLETVRTLLTARDQ